MKRVVRMLGFAAIATATFLGAPPQKEAAAQSDAPAEIRVRVIHASNEKKKFDPDLEDLRKFLSQHKFSAFKQVIDETIPLKEQETKGIGLLSGKNLNVTLKSLTREKATIRLLLLGQTGQILDTTVAAGPHKLFFIAGPKYENGVLFVAIEPHYEPEKVVEKGAFVKDDGGKKTH